MQPDRNTPTYSTRLSCRRGYQFRRTSCIGVKRIWIYFVRYSRMCHLFYRKRQKVHTIHILKPLVDGASFRWLSLQDHLSKQTCKCYCSFLTKVQPYIKFPCYLIWPGRAWPSSQPPGRAQSGICAWTGKTDFCDIVYIHGLHRFMCFHSSGISSRLCSSCMPLPPVENKRTLLIEYQLSHLEINRDNTTSETQKKDPSFSHSPPPWNAEEYTPEPVARLWPFISVKPLHIT